MRSDCAFATLALIAAACCSTVHPGVLDDDARDSLAVLAPRLERVPPDVSALEETVAIYLAHVRFDDAEATIRGVLERSSLDERMLERVALLYVAVANEADRAMRDDPRLAPAADVAGIGHRAEAIAALARFRAQRDHAPITAEVLTSDGRRHRLRDVMLECTSSDYEPEGRSGSGFAMSYFGDRLRVEPGGGGSVHGGEPRLGEIARLTLARDPMGRAMVRIEPYPWSTDTQACESCRLTDACALAGDVVPHGGLTHLDLGGVNEARFRAEARP